jgi:hypothetical protein
MNKEIFLQFQDKKVTIVFEANRFKLTGFIRRIYDDSIIFETPQKTAGISMNRIVEVYPYSQGDFY